MAEFSHNDTIKDVLQRAADAEPTLQLTDEKPDEDGPEMNMQGGRTVRGNEEAQKAREVYLQQVAKMREEARKLYEEEEKRRKGLSMGPSGTMVSDNAGHAEPDDVDEYVWSLTTVFPKKTFGSEDDLAATLQQAGLRSKDSVFARRVTEASLNREGSFGASARMHSSADHVMEGAAESDDIDDEDMEVEHDEMSEGEDTTATPSRSPHNSSHPLLDRLRAMGGHTLGETSVTGSPIRETQNQPQLQAPAPALDQQSKQTTQQITPPQPMPQRGGGRADHPLLARLAGAGSQPAQAATQAAAQAAAPPPREESSRDSKMKDVVGSPPKRSAPQQPSHPLLTRLDQAPPRSTSTAKLLGRVGGPRGSIPQRGGGCAPADTPGTPPSTRPSLCTRASS